MAALIRKTRWSRLTSLSAGNKRAFVIPIENTTNARPSVLYKFYWISYFTTKGRRIELISWAMIDFMAKLVWNWVWVTSLSKVVNALITTELNYYFTLDDDIYSCDRKRNDKGKKSVIVIFNLFFRKKEYNNKWPP